MESITLSSEINKNTKNILSEALALFHANKIDDAIQALKRASIVNLDDHTVHENIDQILSLFGQSDKALRIMGQVAETAVANDAVQLTYAKLLTNNGYLEQSIVVLEKFLTLSPDHTKIILLTAETLSRAGRVDDANAKYRRILEIEPTNLIANNALFIHFETDTLISHLRKFLRPIAKLFPAFKRLALRILDSEFCSRYRQYIELQPHTYAEWIDFGHDQWRQHHSHHGNQTLIKSVPGSSLKIENRLQQESKALNEISMSQDKTIEILRRENDAWAMQAAALTDSIGYWDSILTSTLYGQRKYYLLNLSLFAEIYGARASFPEAKREIPFDQLDAFTMEGQIPIQSGYINDSYPENYADILNDADLDRYDEIALGKKTHSDALPNTLKIRAYSSYGETRNNIVKRLPDLLKRKKSAAVFGSSDLFLESACLRNDVSEVTTIRFLPFKNSTTKIESISLDEWDADPVKFDLVIAVNIVDTFGLGTCGEQLNPHGDMELMQRFRKMVRLGGFLALSVPIGKDRLIFNSARIYGALRLPKLLDGWRIVDSDGYDDPLLASNGNLRPLLILRPNETTVRKNTV